MAAEIIMLDSATLESAAKVLRAIADEIEANTYGEVRAAVVVLDSDQLELFGSGDANQYKALYLLEAAKRKLLPHD